MSLILKQSADDSDGFVMHFVIEILLLFANDQY